MIFSVIISYFFVILYIEWLYVELNKYLVCIKIFKCEDIVFLGNLIYDIDDYNDNKKIKIV